MSTPIPSGPYTIDPAHSRIGFVARHAMVSRVRGSFHAFHGSGRLDPAAMADATLDVTIDMTSIDTGNDDRDAHLRSGDFFDVVTYPTARFVSTGVRVRGGGSFSVTGDLTIRGVSRPIEVELVLHGPAIDPMGNTRLGLDGSAVINRKDWGITFNAALDTGGVLISDRITLELDIAAVRDAGGLE